MLKFSLNALYLFVLAVINRCEFGFLEFQVGLFDSEGPSVILSNGARNLATFYLLFLTFVLVHSKFSNFSPIQLNQICTLQILYYIPQICTQNRNLKSKTHLSSIINYTVQPAIIPNSYPFQQSYPWLFAQVWIGDQKTLFWISRIANISDQIHFSTIGNFIPLTSFTILIHSPSIRYPLAFSIILLAP